MASSTVSAWSGPIAWPVLVRRFTAAEMWCSGLYVVTKESLLNTTGIPSAASARKGSRPWARSPSVLRNVSPKS